MIMTKILIFSGYYLPHIGGSINHIHQITERFANQGYKIDIVTLNSDNSIEYEVIDNITIYRLPALHMLENYELLVLNRRSLTILKKIFNKKYDIVFNYTRFHVTSLLALAYCKIKAVPYIHTELGSSHSILTNKLMEFISHIYDHILGYLVITNATQLIVNCSAGGSFLQHLGGDPTRINIISSGVDAEIFCNKKFSKTSRNQVKRYVFITIVSRLIFSKGVQDAILAFSKVQKKYPDIKLLIVGDGPYKSHLTDLIEKNNIKNIFLFGFLEQTQVAKILSITDFIINPSYSESLTSYSVLEGGIMGIPSISTDVGGTREIILDRMNGLLFTPGNVDLLSEKIELLIKDENLRKLLGVNIKKIVEKNCDWDAIVREHERIIGKTIRAFP